MNQRVLVKVLAAAVLVSVGVSRPVVADAPPSNNDSVQIGDQSVQIDKPILSGDLSADEQVRQIESQLRGLSFRQFARDSIVAPVRMNLRYIKDDSGVRLGHEVHILFIVHESIDAFSAADFSNRLLGKSATETSTVATDATSDVLQTLGIESSDPDASYKVLQFALLDSIQLSGLVQILHSSTESQNRIDVSLLEAYDNRWQTLDERELGGPYSGMRGWLTATALQKIDGVLIEARFVMHEPEQWFAGDNYLRSKLPLVLQEAARNLRRRLKR